MYWLIRAYITQKIKNYDLHIRNLSNTRGNVLMRILKHAI